MRHVIDGFVLEVRVSADIIPGKLRAWPDTRVPGEEIRMRFGGKTGTRYRQRHRNPAWLTPSRVRVRGPKGGKSRGRQPPGTAPKRARKPRGAQKVAGNGDA